MYIGEHRGISPLRYPIQTQKSSQNEFSQTTYANNLYQQIIDKNKNNYLLNSNSINKTITNETSIDDSYSQSFTSNSFNIQITSLDSKNKVNIESYLTVEDQNLNISNKINEIGQSIQQLRSEMEKFSSYQLNSFLQPLSSKNKSNRKEIETFSSNFHSSQIQSFSHNLNELTTSIFIFNDKFRLNSNNFTKIDFPSLRRDLNKILNMSKMNMNMIDKNDNILDQRILKEYMKIDKFYEDVNSKTSKNFELFQNNVNGQFISLTTEISDELKSTSNDRQKVALSYQQQIEGIQNNVKNSISHFRSNLANFQRENSSILNDLKNSITRSLNLSQDECSHLIDNLNNSYDQAVDELGKNFNFFQDEMTQTINLIRKKNEKENTSILNVIESEIRIESDFLNETNDKIKKFMLALNDQLELNLKKCQQNASENVESGIQYFKQLFEEKIKPSMKPLKTVDSKLDYIEKRIVDCENSLYNTITKMKVNINQTNDKIIEISKSLDETRKHQQERLNLIDYDLRRIEIERNTLANDQRLVPVEYIEKVGLKFSEELDKKAIELEYKFEQLKYFIQNADPFNPNSSYYRENKNKIETVDEIQKNNNEIKNIQNSDSIKNENHTNNNDSNPNDLNNKDYVNNSSKNNETSPNDSNNKDSNNNNSNNEDNNKNDSDNNDSNNINNKGSKSNDSNNKNSNNSDSNNNNDTNNKDFNDNDTNNKDSNDNDTNNKVSSDNVINNKDSNNNVTNNKDSNDNDINNKDSKHNDSNNASNNNKSSIDTDIFSTSQLYSYQDENLTCSKEESEDSEEATFSTNTLVENPKNDQVQNETQNNNSNLTQQETKSQDDSWNLFSNSDADDEETDEFTFNSKSLNNSLKNS